MPFSLIRRGCETASPPNVSGRKRLAFMFLAVAGAAIVALAGLVLLRGPGRETVDLIDINAALQDLLSKRSAQGAAIESVPALRLRREPIPEPIARILFPALALNPGRNVFDEDVYFRYPAGFQRWHDWSEHAQGGFEARANRQGFREDADTPVAHSGLRVLVTGDSHTDGVIPNVESFPNVLEQRFAARWPSLEVDIINAGKGSYSFYNYLGLLEKSLALNPDIFVVTVFGGNDFIEALPLFLYFNYLPPPATTPEWRQALVSARGISAPSVFQGLGQIGRLKRFPRERPLALSAAIDVTTEIQKTCEAQGIVLIVMYLPPFLDCQRSLSRVDTGRLRTALDLTEENLTINDDLADDYLEAIQSRGILTVDLRAPLRRLEEPAFWLADHHLSTAGHRAVADILEPHVERGLERSL